MMVERNLAGEVKNEAVILLYYAGTDSEVTYIIKFILLISGSWFQISNISYSEVLDAQEAVKGPKLGSIFILFLPLINSYVCSFEDKR